MTSAYAGAAYGNPINSAVSRLARAMPIDDEKAVFSSLAFGAAALKEGNGLVWFPEGQRSPDGGLQRFERGIGLLLDHYRVPVVPVAISGTREAMPPGKALPRPAKVTVVFGELDWSPKVHDQVIGRLDRPGQTKPVTAYFLHADGGSDPLVVAMLGLKASQSKGIVDPLSGAEVVHSDESRIRLLAERYLAQSEAA